jgi:hypothetical protein
MRPKKDLGWLIIHFLDKLFLDKQGFLLFNPNEFESQIACDNSKHIKGDIRLIEKKLRNKGWWFSSNDEWRNKNPYKKNLRNQNKGCNISTITVTIIIDTFSLF